MRDLGKAETVVVKVGTNLLSSKSGINTDKIRDIAAQVSKLIENGRKVILVSSGAIGMGAKALRHDNPVKHIPLKQACAAIGNPLLMTAYQQAFSKYNLLCGQVLITRNVLNNRTGYVNMRAAVTTLMQLDVVPIFNENDVVSTSEINNVFGDNDRMSAYVASKMDADLLVLMTDIDGVYTGNPKTNPEAKLIREISDITSQVLGYAKGAGSTFSTGGMKTKLLAAQIAQRAGCGTLIISGYEENSLLRAMNGEEIGTFILPEARLSQRRRWILNTSAAGSVTVDDGAAKALVLGHKSLLPSGIKNVDGVFNEGDVIKVMTMDGQSILKAVTGYNSSALLRIMGLKTKDIAKVLGDAAKVVFRPEDSVYTD